jgi:hypothetical protein
MSSTCDVAAARSCSSSTQLRLLRAALQQVRMAERLSSDQSNLAMTVLCYTHASATSATLQSPVCGRRRMSCGCRNFSKGNTYRSTGAHSVPAQQKPSTLSQKHTGHTGSVRRQPTPSPPARRALQSDSRCRDTLTHEGCPLRYTSELISKFVIVGPWNQRSPPLRGCSFPESFPAA